MCRPPAEMRFARWPSVMAFQTGRSSTFWNRRRNSPSVRLLDPAEAVCYCHPAQIRRRRMAKQRRPVRTAAKPVRRVKRSDTTRKTKKKPAPAKARPRVVEAKPVVAPAPAAPPAPPRKPGFYEAVAIYELGARLFRKRRHLRGGGPGSAEARFWGRCRIFPHGAGALPRGTRAARAGAT